MGGLDRFLLGSPRALWHTPAMLNLFQSNMLDALARLYLAVREPSRDPLEPETVLLPSAGLQRWLAMALAREQGIAANLDCLLPEDFVWQLIRRGLPETPLRCAMDAKPLTWRLLRRLPEVLAEQDAALARQWQLADSRGRFELAARVAEVFDRYLVYRSDWLVAWEKGRRLGLGADEDWQAALWQQVAAEERRHRARLMRLLEKKLEAGPVAGLPARVAVFGVSSLPPSLWRLLTAFGRHHDVDVFLLNPSQEYWGQLKRGESGEGGHPLLASLGQQGRDFISAVVASDAHEPVGAEAFVAPPQESLLATLQRDLLRQHARLPSEKIRLRDDDRSVQIHVCHSPLREMEALHDELLRLFREQPGLMPDDVLVLCSDIRRYAPLADAVFGTRTQPAPIPYTIADRPLEAEQPLLRRFQDLLTLPGSRFEAERVLALLEEPALCRRFGLDAGDLPLVRRWCEELHVRWGRDAADRRARGLPDDVPLSWREALSRLLAGFALPLELAPADDCRFDGIAPADLVFSVSQAQVMVRLVAFVESLLLWEQRLATPRRLADWADTLQEMVNAFFAETPESRDALLSLRELIAELREQAALAQDDGEHGFGVLCSWLRREVRELDSPQGFLHGAVTIAELRPGRSLPFKVIALLGLDDGAFPRPQPTCNFDLMAARPAAGDGSPRQEDRYLFLETLMAAREVLYLSHVGASDVDGAQRAPSPVLAELLDQLRFTVAAEHPQAFATRLIRRHPLQPFSPRYFGRDETLCSFEPQMAAASRVLQERRLQPGAAPLAVFSGALPPPDDDLLALSLPRLESFLAHPPRFFLRERLGVQLPLAVSALADDEPVSLTATRQLRQRLFDSPELGVASLRAEGLLPAGVWGERLWQQEALPLRRLRARRDALDVPSLPPQDFEWEREGVFLSGQLGDLTPQGIVRVSLENAIYPRDILNLRLSHLLLCLLQPEGIECRSRLLGLRETIELDFEADAASALADLLDAYRQGLCEPLPVFRAASPAYAQHQDMEKARRAYLGHDFMRGDCQDSWTALLWREQDPCDEKFAQWALRFYGAVSGGGQ